MPLYDQDGVARESCTVTFPDGVLVTRALITHSMISFFVDESDEPALLVDRPMHPGAGLALDFALWVETEVG